MLIFLSEGHHITREQVQQREWQLRYYKLPQTALACLKLTLDALFLEIGRVEVLWPVLVYPLTLSVTSCNSNSSESARPGKKTYYLSNVLLHTILTHFLLYLAQSHQYHKSFLNALQLK